MRGVVGTLIYTGSWGSFLRYSTEERQGVELAEMEGAKGRKRVLVAETARAKTQRMRRGVRLKAERPMWLK